MLGMKITVLAQEHVSADVQQECSKDIENPLKSLDQYRSKGDHRAPQDDRAQHAPKQHPVLELRRNAEGAEYQQENENIVHAERLFDEVSSQKFRAGPMAILEKNPPVEAK